MALTNVLVVDDEPFNLDIASECLEGMSLKVDLAGGGEEAWTMLTAHDANYGLVVLDRMMPGMDGMEVLRRMKSNPRLVSIPVVMQTAASSPDNIREGLAAGAYYYLTKPYEPDALSTVVQTALRDAAERLHWLEQVGNHGSTMRNIVRGEFTARSLDEISRLSAFAALAAPDPERTVIGLSELLLNALEHGNLAISYAEKKQLKAANTWREEVERRLELPEYRDRRVSLSIERSEGQIQYRIEDQGAGFDWQTYLEFDPMRAFDPNGRGIALAGKLSFSSMQYLHPGNIVVACVADNER